MLLKASPLYVPYIWTCNVSLQLKMYFYSYNRETTHFLMHFFDVCELSITLPYARELLVNHLY